MIGFGRILCAVDQSPYSRGTLQRAATLASRSQGELVVMTVRAGAKPAVWSARDAGATAASDSLLRDLFAFAVASGGDQPALTVVVADGPVVTAILRTADAYDVSLLVVGMHGPPSGFQELLLSPVTERIVEHAGRPVLAVARRSSEDRPAVPALFRTIVCGVDRSASSRRALQYAIAMASEDSRLVVVHAFEDMNAEGPPFSVQHFNDPDCWRHVGPAIRASYEELIRREAPRLSDVDLRTPVDSASSALLTAARECRADVIVLGATGWYGRAGTTKRVLRHASCDALVVPAAPDAATSSAE